MKADNTPGAHIGNAATALAWLEAFWRGDADAATALCAAQARFVFARSLPYPRQCPVAEAVTAIARDMFASFDPQGFAIDMHSVMSEGDEVAAEYSATGSTRDGRRYENDYVMKFSFDAEGRITRVQPYTDTAHLRDLLTPDAAAPGQAPA